ncbi:hypothetical protein CDAR_477351 [Caerostris darwini]|uniref:Uncharacterized protein n=1 Tax=Caerostris darwini TaxID=1538125 RepID=A0AAV4P650_9ARAC|nr:hypothetical protein CDAR_477351 [Caerostris darwini]
MRKYFDEIKKEDLRSFVSRHANSENGGILIPTFEDVFKIVTEFDEYDFTDFGIGDSELEYVYDYYHPFDEILIIRDTRKLPESPVTLNIAEENNKIEYLLSELGISSVQEVNRAQTKCSFCVEKCFKYLLFHVLYRLHTNPKE